MHYTASRKKSRCSLLMLNGESTIIVNGLPYEQYFKSILETIILTRLLPQIEGKAVIKVVGGGIKAQFSSVKNVIAKTILKENKEIVEENKEQLKVFAKHDARQHERYKPGKKRRRTSPPYNKR